MEEPTDTVSGETANDTNVTDTPITTPETSVWDSMLDDSGKPETPKTEDVKASDDKAEVKPETLVEEKVEPKAEPVLEWWTEGGKYKTPEDFVKAKESATKEMYRLQMEKANLEKRLAERESSEEDLPIEMQQKLEARFKNAYTYDQLKALSTIISEAVSPVRDMAFNTSWQSVKDKLMTDDLVKEFPEFIAEVEKLPMNERLNSQKVQDLKKSFISDNIDRIVSKRLEEKLKSIKGKVPESPVIESGKNVTEKKAKPIFTEEERTALINRGTNPDALESDIRERESGKLKSSPTFAKYFAG